MSGPRPFGSARWRAPNPYLWLVEQLERVAPKVARLVEEAEEELLAYMRFPASTGRRSEAATRSSG